MAGSDEHALALYENRQALSTLVAGFAFTMLGFLAGIITILLAITHTQTYKRYTRAEHMKMLFGLYYLTIVTLLMTAALSIFGFSNNVSYVWSFQLMLALFGNGLLQVSMITIMIVNLARNAGAE